jgi:2-C-methyl-D-erythritol 4-phosphate cytidylyltransferase
MSGAWAIIAAAGEGSRFGGPKAFSPLGGAPMLAYSLSAIGDAKGIAGLVIVVAPTTLLEAANALAPPSIPVEVVRGADTRQGSVRAGLGRVPSTVERVVVHDAARPLVTPAMFEDVLAALDDAAGAIAAIRATDTLKESDGGRVVRTIARDSVWRAQTPQAFRADVLREAHDRAAAESFEATDDATLLERIGETVAIVPGDPRNLKVTTVEDLAVVEAILASRRSEGAR